MMYHNYRGILFALHGLTDNNKDMGSLAHQVASNQTYVIAPNLGIVNTLFEIEPLICQVEQITKQTFQEYPDLPARIIAHSLGGVIWVEVLSRHPEWWQRFESMVLLGSPIGGADLAKIIDPFGWGIGMAKYLGQNRRVLAENITAKIPTLVIAGNSTGGGDGTVPIESTKLKYAHFICLDGIDHPTLRTHPAVVKTIQNFWSVSRSPIPMIENSLILKLIDHFRSVPGITDASQRDFFKSKQVFSFADGTSIITWKNSVGVDHIFIANQYGKCEYAAFVGWVHAPGLWEAINRVIKMYQD